MNYSSELYLDQLDRIEVIGGTAPVIKIFSGAKPTACADANPAGELVSSSLPSDWLAAASRTTKKNKGIAYTLAAATGGSGTTPQSFRIYKTGGTVCFMQGTCGIGSGELSLNGTITAGQVITIAADAFVINAANT